MTHHTRPIPLRRIEPSRSLFDPDADRRHPYVHSDRQETDGVLSRWMWERSSENESVYPDDSSSQVDAAGTYTGE